MTTFWSIYVIFLVVLNIVGCAWLLWWTSKRRGNEGKNASETTGHVWDGDLTEYNKPLPKWWINLFWITIVFSIGYLIWYPGLGNFAGYAGWTSTGEHDAEKAEADARIAEVFGRFEGMPIDEIAAHPEAVAFGGRLFANHCALCHGSDARGAKGFPNLADDSWQWGTGTPDDILQTILHGRQAAMPPLAGAIGGDVGVTEVAAYVQSLSGIKADPALAAAGKARFAGVCAACHGPEGTGNPVLGAPDLSDGVWLYGSDFATISEGIRNGRAGMMPAHEPILGELRSRLVGAYVWSLSHDDQQAVSSGVP
ncbi:MAG TPA: cytochrome-c oxidase, cbb3-type subunit III [Arenimonas sp.]|nr:cytochrome-c oxidase, cbb3-type subunit III [Arenimonas sp.]